MQSLTKPIDKSGRWFEDLCLLVFEEHFKSKDANYYGQNATGQAGIDIRLTSTGYLETTCVLVQCKDVKKLDFTTIEKDLEKALAHFGPELQSNPNRHYLYVVATTLDGRSEEVVTKGKERIAERLPKSASRFDFDVYSWRKIEQMVNSSKVLRDIFHPAPRPADSNTDNNIRTACDAIAEFLTQNLLETAFAEFSNTSLGSNNYKGVPSDAFHTLLKLFKSAGDFVRAHGLLIEILGSRPYEARYLLQYLRSHRVLTMFPRSDHRAPGFPFASTPKLREICNEVDVHSRRLHRAFGTLDEQMTLALWSVTYGSAGVASDGLRRAIGLLAEGWPNSSLPLRARGRYLLDDNGFLAVADGGKWVSNSTVARRDDAALLTIYCYLRHTYEARFGRGSANSVERAHEGFPASIQGMLTPARDEAFLFEYCSVPKLVIQENFPHFAAEWEGRDRLSARPAFLKLQPRPDSLRHGSFVCGVEFLIYDCLTSFRMMRHKDLIGEGMFPRGRIHVSTFSLEELSRASIALQLGFRMYVKEQCDLETALEEIRRLSNDIVRVQAGQIGDAVILAHPMYFDYAVGGDVTEIQAAVALARKKEAVFVCVTLAEKEAAEHLLPPELLHISWWAPPIERRR